jgi:hypothetical protein
MPLRVSRPSRWAKLSNFAGPPEGGCIWLFPRLFASPFCIVPYSGRKLQRSFHVLLLQAPATHTAAGWLSMIRVNQSDIALFLDSLFLKLTTFQREAFFSFWKDNQQLKRGFDTFRPSTRSCLYSKIEIEIEHFFISTAGLVRTERFRWLQLLLRLLVFSLHVVKIKR